MRGISTHEATLIVLHTEHPGPTFDRFLEIRRWHTKCGRHAELIAEYGCLDADGELVTVCEVLPFHLSLTEALRRFAVRPTANGAVSKKRPEWSTKEIHDGE